MDRVERKGTVRKAGNPQFSQGSVLGQTLFSVWRTEFGTKGSQASVKYMVLNREILFSASRETEIVIPEELGDLKNLNNCNRGASLVESKASCP